MYLRRAKGIVECPLCDRDIILVGFIESEDSHTTNIDEEDFSTYRAFCDHCGYGVLKIKSTRIFGTSNKVDYAFNRLTLVHKMQDMIQRPNYIGAEIDKLLDEYDKCEKSFMGQAQIIEKDE